MLLLVLLLSKHYNYHVQKTVLQIPINQQLKNDAEQVAQAQGFSSLQEVIRVFLSKFAANKVEVTIQESVMLSDKSEKRYLKETLDFGKGKNIHSAKNVDELMSQFNADKVS